MGKLRQQVKVLKAEIGYTDTTAKKLVSLPRDATLLDVKVQVVTAFDDTGNDYLSLGTVTDDDYLVNDHDVHTAGFGAATLLQGGSLKELGFTGPVLDVFGIYVGQNGNSTAGKAIVIFVYADPFVNP
jgi:hypothetical protein